MNVLFAGLAMFVFVFLKAFQQRNVAFDAPAWVVIITSLFMAATEVYVITAIVLEGYSVPLVASIGLGAGIGAVLAMRLHGLLFKREGR
jgi:hypothetical protein